jgi:hypothetical protein
MMTFLLKPKHVALKLYHIKLFLCGEEPRSRRYGRTAALSLIVQPYDEDGLFFSFFRLMENWWNETDGEKPKCSGKNLSQCPFVCHKFHVD